MSSCVGGARQDLLDAVEELSRKNRFVLAWVDASLMSDLAEVEAILENRKERATRELQSSCKLSVSTRPNFADNTLLLELRAKAADICDVAINFEDPIDGFGFRFVDDELPLNAVETNRNTATHPDALLLRGGDLVANPLARDLAFELSEREQDIQGQPTHRSRRDQSSWAL